MVLGGGASVWYPLLLLVGLLISATVLVHELWRLVADFSGRDAVEGPPPGTCCSRDPYAVASCWDGLSAPSPSPGESASQRSSPGSSIPIMRISLRALDVLTGPGFIR